MESIIPVASPRADVPLQMINLSDLGLNVMPQTMVELIREEESFATSKNVKLFCKSSTSRIKMFPIRASRVDKSKQTNVSRANDSSENS